MAYLEDDGEYTPQVTKRIQALSEEAYKRLYHEVMEFLARYDDKNRSEVTLTVYMADLSYHPIELVSQALSNIRKTYPSLPSMAVIEQEIGRIKENLAKDLEKQDKEKTANCKFCDCAGFRFYVVEGSRATRKCTHNAKTENQPSNACALPSLDTKSQKDQIPFDQKEFLKGLGKSFPK